MARQHPESVRAACVRHVSEDDSMPTDIVRSLSSLPPALDLAAPPGTAAIRIRDIAGIGLDVTAVELWVKRSGGMTATQPVPILSGVATWRTKEESIERYVVVPLDLLKEV
jgi:hypothetical protein